jgi:hypothetical protein
MRSVMKTAAAVVAAAMLAMAGATVGSDQAQASDWCFRDCPPAGWGKVRPITHWAYYPRYAHTYNIHSTTDPFAYRSYKRRYYPGTSRYWTHDTDVERADFDPPHYVPAWGYDRPTRKTRHRSYHRAHD